MRWKCWNARGSDIIDQANTQLPQASAHLSTRGSNKPRMTAKIYAKDMPRLRTRERGRQRENCLASLSICLTRDLNQLKIDLCIFLVYIPFGAWERDERGGGGGDFKATAALLLSCVACQVQISKIDWNSTCPIRGVLVKPLENYSFQFSARIVINFRKTYIHTAASDFIKLLSFPAPSFSLALLLARLHAWVAKEAATSKGR